MSANLGSWQKRAGRELLWHLSMITLHGRVASPRFCRHSSPKYFPSPNRLLGRLTLPNQLRLLACACRPELRRGSSQAAYADHLWWRKYPFSILASQQVAQQWHIAMLHCSLFHGFGRTLQALVCVLNQHRRRGAGHLLSVRPAAKPPAFGTIADWKFELRLARQHLHWMERGIHQTEEGIGPEGY